MEVQSGEDRKEEHAYVLDFMLAGKSSSSRKEPLAQLIGERWFTLLEATTKPNVMLTLGEKVYIGGGERDKILLIKNRISYADLTQTAKNGMQNVITEIVTENEKRFVDTFNTAPSINIRQHSLELLPGIGKKHLNSILKERSQRKFESFQDITNRIALLQDPKKMVVERIMIELQGNERFYIFVKPYIQKY
ncbi:DUF655 domain-containing protein [Candidatus Marsarchaeota archaeon]|jgi:putative nucleotide binding protein|nr:DUF655 domain-containing protein [Candidatus Marsarchaeota archaeon]MCL5089679.1 DUF655 domain-containing protein [Candidatus Marsarchaeota archaeon]